MLGDLITLPIRLSAQAATLALRTTERIAGGVLDLAGRVMQGAGGASSAAAGGPATASSRPDRDRSEAQTTQRRSTSTGASQNGDGAHPDETDSGRDQATGGGGAATEAGDPLPVEPVVRQPSAAEAESAVAAESSPEPAHVSEEPELVEEFAEQGAEDGAGAEIHVDEPWEGYAELSAKDVIDRLAAANPAELAAVTLYERTHQARKSVLDAAERRLEAQSANPEETRRNESDG